MGKLIKVTNTKDLPEGTLNKCKVQNTGIFVARFGGKYYATRNKWLHFGGNLLKGKLEGNAVTCLEQGSQFNLIDKRVVRCSGNNIFHWQDPEIP